MTLLIAEDEEDEEEEMARPSRALQEEQEALDTMDVQGEYSRPNESIFGANEPITHDLITHFQWLISSHHPDLPGLATAPT